MNTTERKKITVIAKYAVESFAASDWLMLGQLSGTVDLITGHPRLLRSLGFGDDDYEFCAAQVLNEIFEHNNDLIEEVIEHFDIDLWYQQKHPEKYSRVFLEAKAKNADFWREGHLKLFVSHLSSNKVRMSAMKSSLSHWGISAFIAHEDIEATREWRDEVEAGLETMEVLAAVVEPGFKESDWCAQEVGYALGRKIDIIPLRAGLDPFGFFGKFQGIQIKGKYPEVVAGEIAELLLKKPKHRDKLLRAMSKAFSVLPSDKKVELIHSLDSWSIATDAQIKTLLESIALSDFEKRSITGIISRVKAYEPSSVKPEEDFDDIPF